MDICEVVWGSRVFYAFYDAPDLVKAFLEIITQTYVEFMRAWTDVVPFRPGGNAHWGLFHKGNIVLRDDSAMNLSPDTFDEFVRPYDQRLLDEFGGGAIHFCGRGDHYIARMSTLRGLHAINLTQPEYNDMETIFCHTVDKGIKLIGLPPEGAQVALREGRNLRGQVHAGVADQRRLRP
jgi:uroporphyrinogen-III decarboxylase